MSINNYLTCLMIIITRIQIIYLFKIKPYKIKVKSKSFGFTMFIIGMHEDILDIPS